MRKTIKANKYIIDQMIQLIFLSVVGLGVYHVAKEEADLPLPSSVQGAVIYVVPAAKELQLAR